MFFRGSSALSSAQNGAAVAPPGDGAATWRHVTPQPWRRHSDATAMAQRRCGVAAATPQRLRRDAKAKPHLTLPALPALPTCKTCQPCLPARTASQHTHITADFSVLEFFILTCEGPIVHGVHACVSNSGTSKVEVVCNAKRLRKGHTFEHGCGLHATFQTVFQSPADEGNHQMKETVKKLMELFGEGEGSR